MSFQLSTLGLSLPSTIYNRKTINHFSVSCNTKSFVCKSWGSKCAAAAKKKDTRLSLKVDYRRQGLKQLVTNCSKLSGEEDVLDRSKEDYFRTKFDEVYLVLKSELLDDPAFEWTEDSRQWVQQMLDYNVPGGKLARGFSVVNSYKLLKEGKELSEEEVFDANVLGWCIEWLEAASLIIDDFTDNSHTRRGQTCWYRVPKVGKTAINDAVLLTAHIRKIMKKHFRERPFYVDLLDLLNEVEFQALSGQMLDLITPNRERDFSNYTLHNFRLIAKYKTGYCSCYFPIACALLLAGENLEKHVNMKDVLLEIGIHFQAANDYLDYFGNPEKTGKIGTDIEDFKCSWLIVKALELANEEQKKVLHEHYGKANPSDVARVKGVYSDINLQGVFAVYENESYEKITSCVESHPNKILQEIWASMAYYRQLYLNIQVS